MNLWGRSIEAGILDRADHRRELGPSNRSFDLGKLDANPQGTAAGDRGCVHAMIVAPNGYCCDPKRTCSQESSGLAVWGGASGLIPVEPGASDGSGGAFGATVKGISFGDPSR